LADWDLKLLAQEIGDLHLLNFDMDLLGFSGDELSKLLDDVGARQVAQQ
jgi:hypothetical protein